MPNNFLESFHFERSLLNLDFVNILSVYLSFLGVQREMSPLKSESSKKNNSDLFSSSNYNSDYKSDSDCKSDSDSEFK